MQRGDASASTWCVMPPGVMTIGSVMLSRCSRTLVFATYGLSSMRSRHPGDLKKGLRDEIPAHIDDEYLLMVSEVIKHENWRSQHPEVNFLLLCSSACRIRSTLDRICAGPAA